LSKRLLLVAYPLLPVVETSMGGTEQALWTLERELSARGWETEVAACAGAPVNQATLAAGAGPELLDGFEERKREHAERVVATCAERDFAMVLDHNGNFFRHAQRVRGCVLATLHLPRQMYPADAFEAPADNVSFVCVSDRQNRHSWIFRGCWE
jgi:hypothetical protein